MYGSATTRQIIKCTHYKCSLRAHIYSYMALYELAIDQFLKVNPDLKDVCLEATAELEEACSVANKNTKISSIPDLCCHLFCKYMAESEKLPPTMGALK